MTTSLEELRFRSIAGPEDADALHAVRAGCIAEDKVDLQSEVEGLATREDFRAGLTELIAAQRQNQLLIAEVGDRVVGYSRIECWYEQDGRWVYLILGWVLPEWRGRGIGSAMLHWGEQTACQLAATEHPNQPFEFAANASSTMPASTALLINDGYYVGYTVLDMQLDHSALQSPQPLPAGIEVRPVLPEHYPLIADSIDESYRSEYPDNRFRQAWNAGKGVTQLSASRHDSTLWQVAWEGSAVVGQVIPVIEKGRAAIDEVSVRPGWRRNGLARALLLRALQGVRERGVEMVRLHTVAEFPTHACDLYRSVGFRVVKEFPRYRKSA